jgi:hypothetical protein
VGKRSRRGEGGERREVGGERLTGKMKGVECKEKPKSHVTVTSAFITIYVLDVTRSGGAWLCGKVTTRVAAVATPPMPRT